MKTRLIMAAKTRSYSSRGYQNNITIFHKFLARPAKPEAPASVPPYYHINRLLNILTRRRYLRDNLKQYPLRNITQ